MTAYRRIAALFASLTLFSSAWLLPASAQSIALPVPRATIYPGDTISADMLHWRNFQERSVQTSLVASTMEAIAGSAARRTLIAGQPIPRAAVGRAFALKQGDAALAVFTMGGLRITCSIVTLEGGAVGDAIRARNVETSAVITGTIQADGSLRVN